MVSDVVEGAIGAEGDSMEQLTIFDLLREPVDEIAERMNKTFGTDFREVMNTGYYHLYVFVTNKHRFVIDGTGNDLSFGVDGSFLGAIGFDDIAKRYREWTVN